DVVLCGIRSSDGDCYLVGPAVAELLDLPQLTSAKDAQLQEGTVTIQREADGALEVVRAKIPVLLTVTKAAFEPRLATFKGITAANKKEILGWSASDLGVANVGMATATVRVTAVTEPPARPQSQVLTGSAGEVARQLAHYLHEHKLV
ncbi:MAG: electron transfer flavoprotein subunit beta, partial [Cyanobacteria bacterium REEB65]|nr:electron transfer flavoprotein subunit beta [Cyanobacteria bacterium REEB65]